MGETATILPAVKREPVPENKRVMVRGDVPAPSISRERRAGWHLRRDLSGLDFKAGRGQEGELSLEVYFRRGEWTQLLQAGQQDLRRRMMAALAERIGKSEDGRQLAVLRGQLSQAAESIVKLEGKLRDLEFQRRSIKSDAFQDYAVRLATLDAEIATLRVDHVRAVAARDHLATQEGELASRLRPMIDEAMHIVGKAVMMERQRIADELCRAAAKSLDALTTHQHQQDLLTNRKHLEALTNEYLIGLGTPPK